MDFLFAPFEKVEEQEDGTVKVFGIASSESEDSDGDIMKADAVRAALPDWAEYGNIREMHQPIAAGVAIEAHVDDAGITHLGAHVVDPSSVAKVRAKVLKGFSLGGTVTKRNRKDKKIIEGIKLTEISLVDRPANPDARISLVKFDKRGRIMAKAGDQKPAAAKDEPLKKGMYDVGRLASLIQEIHWLRTNAEYERSAEGDSSTVPDQLKDWCAQGCTILRDMVSEETAELLGLTDEGDDMLEVAAKKIDTGDLAKGGMKHHLAKMTEISDHAEKCEKLMEKCHKAMGDHVELCKKAIGAEDEDDDKEKDEKSAKNAKPGSLSKSIRALLQEDDDEDEITVEELVKTVKSLKKKLSKSESEKAEIAEEALELVKTVTEKGKGALRIVGKGGDTIAKGDDTDEDEDFDFSKVNMNDPVACQEAFSKAMKTARTKPFVKERKIG